MANLENLSFSELNRQMKTARDNLHTISVRYVQGKASDREVEAAEAKVVRLEHEIFRRGETN